MWRFKSPLRMVPSFVTRKKRVTSSSSSDLSPEHDIKLVSVSRVTHKLQRVYVLVVEGSQNENASSIGHDHYSS